MVRKEEDREEDLGGMGTGFPMFGLRKGKGKEEKKR